MYLWVRQRTSQLCVTTYFSVYAPINVTSSTINMFTMQQKNLQQNQQYYRKVSKYENWLIHYSCTRKNYRKSNTEAEHRQILSTIYAKFKINAQNTHAQSINRRLSLLARLHNQSKMIPEALPFVRQIAIVFERMEKIFVHLDNEWSKTNLAAFKSNNEEE